MSEDEIKSFQEKLKQVKELEKEGEKKPGPDEVFLGGEQAEPASREEEREMQKEIADEETEEGFEFKRKKIIKGFAEKKISKFKQETKRMPEEKELREMAEVIYAELKENEEHKKLVERIKRKEEREKQEEEKRKERQMRNRPEDEGLSAREKYLKRKSEEESVQQAKADEEAGENPLSGMGKKETLKMEEDEDLTSLQNVLKGDDSQEITALEEPEEESFMKEIKEDSEEEQPLEEIKEKPMEELTDDSEPEQSAEEKTEEPELNEEKPEQTGQKTTSEDEKQVKKELKIPKKGDDGLCSSCGNTGKQTFECAECSREFCLECAKKLAEDEIELTVECPYCRQKTSIAKLFIKD